MFTMRDTIRHDMAIRVETSENGAGVGVMGAPSPIALRLARVPGVSARGRACHLASDRAPAVVVPFARPFARGARGPSSCRRAGGGHACARWARRASRGVPRTVRGHVLAQTCARSLRVSTPTRPAGRFSGRGATRTTSPARATRPSATGRSCKGKQRSPHAVRPLTRRPEDHRRCP
jgi:hypothetical protein